MKATPSPVAGKSIDVQPPSPEMLRAVFDTLRQLGWQTGNEAVGIDHRCPMPSAPDGKKLKPPTTTQLQAIFALARELGWMNLNDDEKGLVLKLRRTTYHGRKVVHEVAKAISRDFPWVDGSPYNTKE